MKANQLLLVSIISLSIMICVFLVAAAMKEVNNSTNVIEVTGIAQRNVESDMIIWNASINLKSADLISAYAQMKSSSNEIINFFESKGVAKADITFSAVDVAKEEVQNVTSNSKSSISTSYRLIQAFTVSSKQVAKTEQIIQVLPEMFTQNIVLISQTPEYYYSFLADLKLDMLAAASLNGLARAKTITENGNGSIGKLVNSTMGAFKINDYNAPHLVSSEDSVSTHSRIKIVTVTVKMKYRIK